MRNLTIQRFKSFAGCAAKVKVYIEDPWAGDMTIKGCNCRKLGTLKNGETKTFKIGENAAKVFVIAGNLSKGYCNDFYPLPEGGEDITLTGQNCFNPANGNAFRFHNVNDEDVLRNRKKGFRIGLVVLILAILFGFAVGTVVGDMIVTSMYISNAEPQTFHVSGMQITLTDEFEKQNAQGYTAAYSSDTVAVVVLKESFAQVSGQLTLEEYGKQVIRVNGMNTSLKTEDGIMYFEFDADTGDGTYHYVAAIFKGPDAFWLVQFATRQKNASKLRDDIFDWAKTVTFE